MVTALRTSLIALVRIGSTCAVPTFIALVEGGVGDV